MTNYTPEQITRQAEIWSDIAHVLESAHAIASDECHRIYIVLDDEQVKSHQDYSLLITRDEQTPSEMLNTVQTWFDSSCELRFIESVKTTADGKDEFTQLITQGNESFSAYIDELTELLTKYGIPLTTSSDEN